MSKAILVLDEMPETCRECPLCGDYDEVRNTVYCRAEDQYFPFSDVEKWYFCPLEELPEPLEPSSEDTKAFEEEFAEWHLVKWNKGFREGWNCCLNKIGGSDGRIQDNA